MAEKQVCKDCSNKGIGFFYYPYLGGFWKEQCGNCACCFQAYKPYDTDEVKK